MKRKEVSGGPQGGRGWSLGQPGAGMASGHPRQPHACRQGVETMEPGSPQQHVVGG